MTKLLGTLVIWSMIFTVSVLPLRAQTPASLLSQDQQDFITALCMALLNDPDTPGEILPPGLSADDFCKTPLAIAFFNANWNKLRSEFNDLVVTVLDSQLRIDVLEQAAAVDLTALEADVTQLKQDVTASQQAIATLQSVDAALQSGIAGNETDISALEQRVTTLEGGLPPPPPPPSGTDLFSVVDNETGDFSQYDATSSGNVIASQGQVATGLWSARIDKATVSTIAWLLKTFPAQGAGSVTTWSFAVFPVSVGNTGDFVAWENSTFNAPQIRLILNSDFTLTAMARGVTLFTTSALQQNAWTRLDVRIALDDVSGEVEVLFNGASAGKTGSLDTFDRAIDRVRLGSAAGWRGQYEFFIDDLVGRE